MSGHYLDLWRCCCCAFDTWPTIALSAASRLPFSLPWRARTASCRLPVCRFNFYNTAVQHFKPQVMRPQGGRPSTWSRPTASCSCRLGTPRPSPPPPGALTLLSTFETVLQYAPARGPNHLKEPLILESNCPSMVQIVQVRDTVRPAPRVRCVVPGSDRPPNAAVTWPPRSVALPVPTPPTPIKVEIRCHRPHTRCQAAAAAAAAAVSGSDRETVFDRHVPQWPWAILTLAAPPQFDC